jgi:hypothetical protein
MSLSYLHSFYGIPASGNVDISTINASINAAIAAETNRATTSETSIAAIAAAAKSSADATASAVSTISIPITSTLTYNATNTLTNSGLVVPSGKKAIITSIRVANISATDDAITAQINVSGSISSEIANAVPVEVGGSVELLLNNKVMSPNDTLLFKSLSASNGLHVIVSYYLSSDMNYINVANNPNSTLGDCFVVNGTNGSTIKSCLLTNVSNQNYGVTVAWVNASNVVQAYLVNNYVVPVNSTIEIMQNDLNLPNGHKLQTMCDGGTNTMNIYVSAHNN